jgi:hypothetical protein
MKLEIERERWGENKGKFKGQAIFDGATGSVSLNLNQDHCDEIFRICADGIVDVAKASARMLVNEAIGHKNTLLIEGN